MKTYLVNTKCPKCGWTEQRFMQASEHVLCSQCKSQVVDMMLPTLSGMQTQWDFTQMLTAIQDLEQSVKADSVAGVMHPSNANNGAETSTSEPSPTTDKKNVSAREGKVMRDPVKCQHCGWTGRRVPKTLDRPCPHCGCKTVTYSYVFVEKDEDGWTPPFITDTNPEPDEDEPKRDAVPPEAPSNDRDDDDLSDLELRFKQVVSRFIAGALILIFMCFVAYGIIVNDSFPLTVTLPIIAASIVFYFNIGAWRD